MDAHDIAVRQLLLAAMEAEERGSPPQYPREALAMTCGTDAPGDPVEQYTALIGDWTLAQDPQAWRVRMVPRGTTMWVSVDRHALMPPPPPSIRTASPTRLPSPDVYVLPIGQLTGIREAWSSPEIWKQAAEWKGCTDGRPALFEACVHGKYVASRRVCGEAAEAIDLLWARMQSDLPVPRPAQLPSARGAQ